MGVGFLIWCTAGGPAKVVTLMVTCGVEQKRRVGGLAEQQRQRLLEAVAL